MLNELWQITEGFNRRFPDGNHPFQIMTRLLEECGELAQQINHFEGAGVKREKYGEPDKNELAKEILHALCGSLQIARYYDVRRELEVAIKHTFRALKQEGYIPNNQ